VSFFPKVSELVRPTARSMRWLPLIGSGLVGAVIVFLQTRQSCALEGGGSCVDLGTRISMVRMAAVLLAVGAGFVLDDPTEDSTAHLPVSLLLRRAVRIGFVLPLLAAFWVLSMWLAARTLDDPGSFPNGDVMLEAAALAAVALALAAATAPFVPERLGGVAAGPALLGLVVGALFLPSDISIWVQEPALDRWNGAHEAWGWVLLGAVAVLAFASRDPWRPGLRPRLARRRGLGSEWARPSGRSARDVVADDELPEPLPRRLEHPAVREADEPLHESHQPGGVLQHEDVQRDPRLRETHRL
jgi:hypothetical protein